MTCDNCGKDVAFILAWKVKGHSGHFCSKKCAHEATFSTDYERGGILELIVGLFMLFVWLVKWFVKGSIWATKKIVKLIKGYKSKKAAASAVESPAGSATVA